MKIKGLHIYNNDTFVEPCVANIYDMKEQFSPATSLEGGAEEVILAVVEDLQVTTKKPGANPTDIHQLISVVEEDHLVTDVILDSVSKRICGYTSLTGLAIEFREFDDCVRRWQSSERREDSDKAIEELGIKMAQLASQRLDFLEIGSFANYDEYRLFCRKTLAATLKHMSNFLLDIS
jgi:hypothetical protein